MMQISAFTINGDGLILSREKEATPSLFKNDDFCSHLDEEDIPVFLSDLNHLKNGKWLRKVIIYDEKKALFYANRYKDQFYCFLLDDDIYNSKMNDVSYKFFVQSNILALTDDVLYVYDADNQTFTNIYQHGNLLFQDQTMNQEIMEKYAMEKIVEEDRPLFMEWFHSLNEKKGSFSFNIRMYGENGKWIMYSFSGSEITEFHSRRVVIGKIQALMELNGKDIDFSRFSEDPLTRLYHKTMIVDLAKKELAQRIENNDPRPLAFAIVDLDNFKQINDLYGHAFGDRVLLEVARRLREKMPKYGPIGRIGGDEFFLLLDKMEDADELPKILHDVEDIFFSILKGQVDGFSCSCTIGASCYPRDAQDYTTLFLMADKALYRGKKKGKSCYVIYTIEKTGPIQENNHAARGIVKEKYDNTLAIFLKNIMVELLKARSGEESLRNILEDIVENYLLDRMVIYQVRKDGSLQVECSCAKNIAEDEIENSEPANEITELYIKKLDESSLYINNSVESLRDVEPTLFTYLYFQKKIKALVAKGIKNDKGKVCYIVEYQILTKKRLWSKEECNVFAIISEMLSLYLLNKK